MTVVSVITAIVFVLIVLGGIYLYFFLYYSTIRLNNSQIKLNNSQTKLNMELQSYLKKVNESMTLKPATIEESDEKIQKALFVKKLSKE